MFEKLLLLLPQHCLVPLTGVALKVYQELGSSQGTNLRLPHGLPKRMEPQLR